MNISTDQIVGAGLVITLIAGLFVGSSTELQTTIASGLIGFLSRGIIEHKQ